ncbi:Gp49 family protein [Actinomycetospora straminea]|uniref:Gp49 family protein n=1 Tax=Actinomycetospora straminea TaxID=663607 RepID=UPI0023665BC2|nr:Gp49 family protein [Actinomycetospora straminea]MDD7936736.1 Gp49 family protein [Actinomycetospora straminea]
MTLDDLKAQIDRVDYLNPGRLVLGDSEHHGAHPLDLLTICIVTTRTGFTVVGKSAPASPENFNEELGQKLAYEDALRQLWPFEGYRLRVELAAQR